MAPGSADLENSESSSRASGVPGPRPSERERFLVIGRVVGAVGLDGALRAQILTDFPERFGQLMVVHIGDNLRPYVIQSSKLDGDSVLLKLAGIDDAEAARSHRNKDISIPIDLAVELQPNQYFWHQIMGMDVVADDGRVLGTVTEVLRTGSNDVYVVGRGSRELLIPAIEDVVLSIDPSRGRIVVHLLPGIENKGPKKARG